MLISNKNTGVKSRIKNWKIKSKINYACKTSLLYKAKYPSSLSQMFTSNNLEQWVAFQLYKSKVLDALSKKTQINKYSFSMASMNLFQCSCTFKNCAYANNVRLFLHKSSHYINRQRENNGRVLLCCDGVKSLQVTELNGGRRLHHDISGFFQRTWRLLFSFGSNNL